MLASPKAGAPPWFPSVKCDQSRYKIRGHASLVPKWVGTVHPQHCSSSLWSAHTLE